MPSLCAGAFLFRATGPALQPLIPEYEYGLGIVRKEQGDLAGALAAFKASAVGNPDPLPAQTQIAELEGRLKHDER